MTALLHGSKMGHHITLAAVVILCFLSTSFALWRRHHHKKHHVKTQSFDFLVFTQQWAESVCVQAKETHEHQCVIPSKVKTWTVHGIWPSRRSGEGPYNCNRSAHFDPQQLKSIMPQLNQYWPNLFKDSEATGFWKHEWEKHGTCAMVLPSMSNELKFFKTGLKWNRKYDLYSALMKKNIKPGSSEVSRSAVVKALSSAFGGTPRLTCFNYEGETYLNQIELCVTKQLKVFDCPASSTTLRFVPRYKQYLYSEECSDSFMYPTMHH